MPYKPIKTVWLFIAATLLGCGSFNTYHYPAPILVVAEPTTTKTSSPSKKAATKVQPEAVSASCVYAYVTPEPIPRLPLNRLEKMDREDDEAMDDIQQNHIAELRSYIMRNQKRQIEAYQDYMARCHNIKIDAKNTK